MHNEKIQVRSMKQPGKYRTRTSTSTLALRSVQAALQNTHAHDINTRTARAPDKTMSFHIQVDRAEDNLGGMEFPRQRTTHLLRGIHEHRKEARQLQDAQHGTCDDCERFNALRDASTVKKIFVVLV